MDIKRVLPTTVAVVSSIAAAACAFGWYQSEHWGEEKAFISCKDLGGQLELAYAYRSGDSVRFTRELSDQGVSWSYRIKVSESDPRRAIEERGRLRVEDEEAGKFYGPTGDVIECEQVDSAEQ